MLCLELGPSSYGRQTSYNSLSLRAPCYEYCRTSSDYPSTPYRSDIIRFWMMYEYYSQSRT
eukprot:scaffold96450_cov21-Prasinocladus_malaysianus.AAC.1